MRSTIDEGVRAVLILMLATTAAACTGDGGGESMTLEEYFAEFERIGDRAKARSENLESPDIPAGAPFDESRAAFASYIAATIGSAEQGINELRGIAAPDEVKDEHAEYVSELQRLLAYLDTEYERRLADADSVDELSIVPSPDDDALFDGVAKACADLQRIAEGNDIDVDLDC